MLDFVALNRLRCQPASRPIEVSQNHQASTSAHPRLTLTIIVQAIGGLMYAANSTRPDISQAVSFCARETSAPTADSVLRVKRIFRYLAGTSSMGLRYSGRRDKPLTAVVYSDSDWAGDSSDAKSTTGN